MQRIIQLTLFLLLALAFTGCTDELARQQDDPIVPAQEILPKSAINATVENHLQTTNTVFDWNDADPFLVYSAVAHNNQQAALGYQPAGFTNLAENIHAIEVTAGAWKATRDQLMQRLRSETERLTGTIVTEADLLAAPEDGVLPILEVKLLHPELVEIFRSLPEVRYLEPSGYEPAEVTFRSGSGCDISPASSIPSADFAMTSAGARIPWNFNFMNIPQAWSVSQGDNIGVCIIDTGVAPGQSRLNGTFSSGSSTGRYRSKFGTYVSSWWPWASPDGPDDQCGHGTQMAGLATAPNVSGGSSVGVAYKANLIAYRGTGDVIVNGSSEKTGVKNALVAAGNRSDVQVISMSIGDVFSSGTVTDGINYAYNRGKLIFCAAGTSLSWTSWWGVIFPANLSNTVAVTGIRSGSPMQRCNTCHDGSEVDFVAVMQRSEDTDRTSLTLAESGNTPAYVGGSSAATATTAGIAALVWATNPGQSRTQVLNRMKAAASIYPGRNGNFGWGIVDAYQAVTN